MNKDIFSSLAGTWQVDRRVTGSMQSSMRGQARMTPIDDNHLHYREEMDVPGNAGKAFQEYIYVRTKAGIDVFFTLQDRAGEHFLTLEPQQDKEGARATGRHLCGCDLYEAQYHWPSDGVMDIRFEVKGPNKDYQILSQLTRTPTR